MAITHKSNIGDYADGQAEKRAQKPLMRRQKGWPGFVHNYKNMIKIFDEVWEDIDWNKDPEKSGAKEVEKTDFKTIYKF